jgi:hypothetical protein
VTQTAQVLPLLCRELHARPLAQECRPGPH